MQKFLFLLLFISAALFIVPNVVFGQNATSAAALRAPTYDLPYPGILPDNPLYILKAFRDRVVSILISDPLKKAEFDLLNSDKRMSGGLTMLNQGKDALGVTTISKSNNYFEEALAQLINMHQLKQSRKSLAEKMNEALVWREYILNNTRAQVKGATQSQLQKEEDRVEGFKKKLNASIL